VSESASLFDFFKGLPSGVESTGYIRRDGKFEQYRPLNVECDANGDGNSFAFNGHRGGFNSWETQGGEFGEWSDKQIETIKFIIRFKHDNYGTPLRLAPDWNKAGFGYHRLHNEWNKNGHSCPGPDRVKQFNRVIVPWMRGGAPMKEDEVDEKVVTMTCVWEPDPACLGDDWAELSPEVQARSLMLASSSLQMLTYYRVGTCPVTIRPCPAVRPCHCAWNPHMSADGLWRNNCEHGSTCTPLSEVDIPGPVGYIDNLVIDGVEMDLYNGDWRLDNGHLLVWQGTGLSPLPTYQDLNVAGDVLGGWSITYSRSYPVSADGRLAVAYLAAEFAKACIPKKKCSLPRGVTSVVRNGVSFTLEAGLFPNGLTGIDIVDQFILKWAPAGSPLRNAQVYNPSRYAPRVRVTSGVPRRPAGTPPEGFGSDGFGD
jgi:hypothetical protein